MAKPLNREQRAVIILLIILCGLLFMWRACSWSTPAEEAANPVPVNVQTTVSDKTKGELKKSKVPRRNKQRRLKNDSTLKFTPITPSSPLEKPVRKHSNH